MSKLKIIHAADLHLDSPAQALGSKAAQRRREQRELLGRIAALVREKQADLLLLPGDLLDSVNAYAETSAMLRETFMAVDCPVFIAPGNHDFYSPSSPYARMELPDNVHIFTGGMDCVSLDEPRVNVWGAGYTDISCPPRLRDFHLPEGGDRVNICLLHADLDAPGSPYCPVTGQEIAASGFDYIALGHVHTCSGLMKFGGTYCAYPGCPEGRGFDECGEKGVLYVELDGGKCSAEFIPVCKRKYEILSLDVSEGPIASRLPPDAGEDIYRIILTGECDFAPDIKALEKELEPRFFALQIKDRTVPRRDIWERCGQDSLRGLFLRKMRALYDGAGDEEQRRQIVQSVRWGLAAIDGGEAVSEL